MKEVGDIMDPIADGVIGIDHIYAELGELVTGRAHESRPSNLLMLASVIMGLATLIIVYSPIGPFFEFVQPPLWFLGLIFGILIVYFLMVEVIKHIFFSRNKI